MHLKPMFSYAAVPCAVIFIYQQRNIIERNHEMNSATKKKYLNIVIAAIIFALIRIFLKPGNGLTDAGVTVLALFVATIWMWVFIGVDWTSLLVPAIMIMTGVLGQTDMLAKSFGNFCFAFVLTAMLLNEALTSTGVIQHIATWFISRKICKGRPWVFVTMFLLSCFLVELFLDCTPVTLIYLTMIDGVCKELGYEKGSKFGKALTAAVIWLVAVGYAATPIAHPIAVIMMGYIEAAGGSISFIQYMAIGIPYGFLFFGLTIGALRLLCNPDFSNFENYDIDKKRAEMEPLSKQAKISVVVFLLVVLMWMMPDALAAVFPTLSAYFAGVGVVAPAILGIVLLAVIHVDNKPVMDVKSAVYKISIPTLIFIVGIQSFANTLNSDVTGVSTFLANIFSPIAANLSGTALVWIALLLAIILTQFLSNLVVQALLWPVFLPVILAANAAGAGINVVAFGVILSIICNASFLFPSSYVCAAMCYGTGYLEVKDGLKIGTPVVVATYLLIMLICWPLAQVIC